MLQLAASAIAVALVVVAVPLAVAAAGLVVFPIDLVLKMAGIGGSSGLASWYVRMLQAAFAPEALPTWLPRVVVLVLGLAALTGAVTAWIGSGTRRRFGPLWWRALPSPLAAAPVADHCWRVMWDLIRGAAQLKQPPVPELGRRYTEMLSENLGQPGFRELMLVVHDVDARRDLVFALVAEPRRRELVKRPTTEAADTRRAEVFDLSGVGRDYLADAVAGALAVPLATEPREVRFAPDAYWRGETHRLSDRPASLARLLEELAGVDVEQAVVVSAAPEPAQAYALSRPPTDGRSRIGEYLQSSEASILRDAAAMAADRLPRLFTIRPVHNPIGPFEFSGGYDDRSDRLQPLVELMNRGYEDAYHQFIEPVVGASGERVGTGRRRRARMET